MDHGLLGDIFRYARDYHGALRRYAAAMRAGDDIESPAQSVIGASVRYRMAIDRLLEDDPQSSRVVAGRGRLERLRKVLATTSRRYNLVKHPRGGNVRSAHAEPAATRAGNAAGGQGL